MKKILRKCKVCDENKSKSINLETDKFIFYKGCYYHYDCYVNELKNENKLSESQIIENANKKLVSTQKSKPVNDSIDKDRFYYWIYDNYNITVLPPLFYQKVQQINKGRYSNKITVSISCYDLLQIFIKIKPYIDKIHYKNERKQKEMTIAQRLSYDLSIVINNYDDYIKWKQKQKTEKVNNENIKIEMKNKKEINTNNIINVQKNNKSSNDEINISDLLDEVF